MQRQLEDNVIEQLIKLKQEGISSRKIAKQLGCGKSSVNHYFKKYTQVGVESVEVKKPKVLLYDLEVGSSTVLTFGRRKQFISQDAIVKHGGHILCFSYMWLGDKEPSTFWLTPEELLTEDDSRLAVELYDLYSQADAIVCHNSTSYDHKVTQTRCTKHGLPKLPTVKVLDTLLLARRNLRLSSNTLDNIADYFDLGRKIQTTGMSLWKAVQQGDQDAMQSMVDYCKQDTKLLRDVYLRLRHLGKAGEVLNHALYNNKDYCCPVCGSEDVEKTGRTVKTSVATYEEHLCNGCGYVARGRSNTNEAKTLL